MRRWGTRDLWLATPMIGLVLAFLAAGAGLIPMLARLGHPLPLWSLALGGLCTLVGMVAFLRLRTPVTALAALPLALMIGLHVGLSPLLFARYDMTDLGRAVAPHDAAGIAVTDGSYHAQLNFAGRLLNPVARLSDDAVEAWRRDHPDGVLLDQTDRPIPGMTPILRLPFRDRTYTLHHSQEVAP